MLSFVHSCRTYRQFRTTALLLLIVQLTLCFHCFAQGTEIERSTVLSKLDEFFHPLIEVSESWHKPVGTLSQGEVERAVRQLRNSTSIWSAGQMMIDDQARVQVYLKTVDWNDEYPLRLNRLGIRVELVKPEMQLIQCSIPANELVRIASFKWVKYIAKPNYPDYTHTLSSLSDNEIRHEGEFLPRFDEFRELTNIDGTGYKVGVISDGIARIAESQAVGELPDVTAISFRGDEDLNAGGEGTAILEQIYDTLPGAELYFSNNDTEVTFVESVNWLADRCDVIVGDEVFTDLGPRDGGSYVERALTKASEKTLAITWAVGNAARNHYEALYWDPDGNGRHNFSADREYLTCSVWAGGTLTVSLSWDDHFLMERKNDFTLQARPLEQDFPIIDSISRTINAGIEAIGDSFTNPGYPVELLTWENDSEERKYFRIYIDGPWFPQERLLRLSVNGNKGGRLEDFVVPQNSLGSIAVAKGVTTSGAYDSRTACTDLGEELGEDAIGSWAYTIEPFSSFGWTSDGRMLPSTCFPDKIDTFSDFWNWDLKPSQADYVTVVGGDGSGSSMTCDDVAGYNVCMQEDGSAMFTVGGQDISLSSEVLTNLNECIQTTSSAGMTMHITGGAPSPDLVDSHEMLESFRDVQLQLGYTPEGIIFSQVPGVYKDQYITLSNPHSSLTVPGTIVFDPRSLMLKTVEFHILPRESLRIRVRTRPSLKEGFYRSKIYIGYLGMEQPIEIPVEVRVQSEQNDNELFFNEQEPNNPLRLDHLFAFAQELVLPLSTEEHPGPPMLTVKGNLSTSETGLEPATNREDLEDWYWFEVPEAATEGIEITISAIPDNTQADLDLTLMVDHDTQWIRDREKDGWPETIGPLPLQPGKYAVGVGIYDYNLPNIDGTFDPQTTDYELRIRREATEPASSPLPKNAVATEVASVGDGAVYIFNQYQDSYLIPFDLEEGSLVAGQAVKGHFGNLQKAPSRAGYIVVVSDDYEPGSATAMQSLRVYDFTDFDSPHLVGELPLGEGLLGCVVHDYALSRLQEAVFAHAELILSETETQYVLLSLDPGSGEELARVDLGGKGSVRFDLFDQHEYVAFQSTETEHVFHYGLGDARRFDSVAEIETTLLRDFTTFPDGAKAYYVPWNDYKAFFEKNLQTDSSQRLPTSDEILDILWRPTEDELVIVGPRNLLTKKSSSGSYGSVMYPDIGTGQTYYPRAPVFIDDKTLAMPIHENAVMIADLETRSATWEETSGEMKAIAYSEPRDGIFYAAGSMFGYFPTDTPAPGKARRAVVRKLEDEPPVGNLRKKARRRKIFEPESEPQLFVYPNMLGFGNVASGNLSDLTAEVWIRNTGRVPAHIYEMNWDSPAFKVLNPIHGEITIDPGQAYKLEVEARPVQPGLEQDLLQIVTDNLDDPNLYVLMSVSGTPDSSFVAGDLDSDGDHSFDEWIKAASYYGKSRQDVGSEEREDFDKIDGHFDGTVDARDIILMMKSE